MELESFERSVSEWVSARNIAVDALTQDQLAQALLQAIACGDFVRLVEAGSGAQQVTYIPFRDVERLRSRVAMLEEALSHYQNHPPPHCDAQEFIQDMGNWQCPKCGERANCKFEDGTWRWNGRAWEHWHGWPLGHVVAQRVPRGTGVQEQDRGGE